MGKVYTVERGATKLRAGQGLGAGLGVVIKHFADAFTKKLDSPNETSGVFTVQYPEEQLPLPEAYRNFPILLYDDVSGQELCTSCFQCQRVCPPQVIHMAQAKDPATGKAVPAVSEFIIEYDACMSCGLCAEVCPFDAIKMDHTFELSTDYHPGLTVAREGLDRPISYYENLAPSFWQEARDNALKKLQANVKRRPGKIGIAPQMVEHVTGNPLSAVATPGNADRGQGSGVRDQEFAEGERRREGEAETKIQASSPKPEASPSDDKAARLAAIRARNAAKQNAEALEQPASDGSAGGEGSGVAIQGDKEARRQADEPPTSSLQPPASQPSTAAEKAARLAAIRAANAAKKAAEPTGEDSAKAQESVAEPPAPQSSAPSPQSSANDEKAARLAAIRAANAAKKAAESTGDRPPTADD